jgi:hypothetical protein
MMVASAPSARRAVFDALLDGALRKLRLRLRKLRELVVISLTSCRDVPDYCVPSAGSSSRRADIGSVACFVPV